MIYFFYGDEEFNIEQEILKLKSKLDKNFLDMSFKTYENPKFPDLITILRTQPMMFGKMLIVIKSNEYFTKTLEDNEIKQIEEALEDNNENLDIVFVAEYPRNEGKKPDSRRKIFKLLSKYNAKEFQSIPGYKTTDLENWVKSRLKGKDLSMTPDAATSLVTQVGNNLRELNGELDKLKLFIYPKKQVTSDDVKKYCISNEDLFAFSDALMVGEKDKALLEYRKLLNQKYCLQILASLQTMLRQWITLKAESKQNNSMELARRLGWTESKVMVNLKKLKNTQLKYLVKELSGYRKLYSILTSTKDVNTACDRVLLEFERPANAKGKINQRRSYCRKYY